MCLSKCSWPLITSVVSALVLASVVHLFLTPLLPHSLDYFRTWSSCSFPNNVTNETNVELGIDLDWQFAANSRWAVTYRGAPWKPEIGRWLSACDSAVTAIAVVESVHGKRCKDDCNGRGVCNQELGECRCFHGFAGEGCSVNLKLDCNLPASLERPFISVCATRCDTTRAMCFCGEGTKYPDRPVTGHCGFKIISATDPNAPILADWTKADYDNILTTNASKPGWCNVDPDDAYASKVNYKKECYCRYDCRTGRFCEIPTLCSCVNQCSGHGHCRGGFCECDSDWYGVDCSIPSTLSAIHDWPMWLRPSTVDLPDKAPLDSNTYVKAVVKKKRPLIYVYDLPPHFNSLLLEGRHLKTFCVNRLYGSTNETVWIDQLYGAQIALYESILASPHRTLNGEEADYFYVPVLDSCIIATAGNAPHLSLQEHDGLRSSLALDMYKKAYDHIAEQYPFWNRSSGKDHIWFFAWDEGACYAPKEIWNSTMLVHWGNTNSKHNYSTTAYWPDSWNDISSDRRGDHPCFDPDKDLVLPAWKRPDADTLWLKLWARPREVRRILFYFNGNLGPAYEKGRPEDQYSIGIRQKLAEEFGSTPNKEGKLGRQHRSDVIVTPVRSSKYLEELSHCTFCGVLPGDGWSGRMEDSILQGCIPVIIQDGIFLPYENILNYKSFAVRISEDQIPNLIHILQGFSETEKEFMLSNVRQIWQRFLYRDSTLYEAQRQKRLLGKEDGWAIEFSKLEEDDVFSTFIQILHYKLHNDPWRRRRHLSPLKDYGLPNACLRTDQQ